MGIDVFISYHTLSSSHITKAICNCLEANGIRCWYAPRDTIGSYANSIANAIDECKVFVVVLNREASFSEDVLNEMNLAFERVRAGEDIAILPFHISSDEISNDAKYYLGRMHWIDAINPPIEERINELKNVIIARLGDSLEKSSNEVATSVNVIQETLANNDIIKKLSEIPVSERWQGYMFIDKTIDSALMVVEDMFHITKRGTVVVGTILRGRISIGDTLEIVGLTYEKETVTVTGIESHRNLLDFAEAGDNVGVLIRTENPPRKKLFSKEYKIAVERGQVLASPNSIHAYAVFECQIRGELFANHSNQLQISSKLQFDFGSTDITGFVENICDEGELNMSIVVRLICPFALETGYGFRILNEKRECITTGVITRLIK